MTWCTWFVLHGLLVATDSTRELPCKQAFILDMYARDVVQALGVRIQCGDG